MQVWDLIVVGAGVAGSALAFSQGQVRRIGSEHSRYHIFQCTP